MKHNVRTLCALIALTLSLGALPAFAGDSAVNVNTASADQLALLPRVGPAVAQRIVAYRDDNGGFKAPEDLMLVRGIGEKTFALIKPYVKLSGETTLSEKVHGSRTPSTAKSASTAPSGSSAKQADAGDSR
jgi:competence protein ComEA